MSGILRLESLTKGDTLKQGDKTPLKYRLFNVGGEKLNIAGKPAKVRLAHRDFLTIAYEKDGLTVAQDDTVTFTIDSIIPPRIYYVEIIVDDKFIFPSRTDESKFTVNKSSLGVESDIIQIIGKEEIVSDVKARVENELEPFLGEIEQAEAKAEEAITKANQADNLSKSVQSQFNQVVIDGDSSVEAAQARVDASGHTNATLKERLDKEHTEVTTQLAQTKNRTQITPDDFEGTDGEKIKQAIYKAIEDEVYTVHLTRKYDLTGDSIDMERGTIWHEVTLIGGTIVKDDDGFIFESSSNTGNQNSPQFVNTQFYGKAGNETYIFNGDHFIRQNMTKCRFWMISLVETSGFIQTLRLLNCVTYHHQVDFIKADNGYDIKVIGHRGEESTHPTARFMNIVTSNTGEVSYIDLQIKDSLFEGYVYNVPFLLGTGYNLQFEGNYFEANGGDIEFINLVGTPVISGSITNNIFNLINGDIHINFSSGSFNLHQMKVENNTVTSGASSAFINRMPGLGDLNSIWTPSGARVTTRSSYTRTDTSLTTSHTNVDGYSRFEFKLHLNNVSTLNYLKDGQYLVNIGFNYANSTAYKGHLTGIVSIDTHVVNGQVDSQLMMTVLSTRNTSGTTDGSLSNPEEYEIYFKETGTDSISYGAREATIVIELPKSVYQSTNYINVKNLNGVMQRYAVDYD